MQAKFTVEPTEDELYCSHVIDTPFTPNRDLWKSWEIINYENDTCLVDIKIHFQSVYYCRISIISIDSSVLELSTVTKGESPAEALYKAFTNLGVEFDSPFEGTLYTDDIADAAIEAICDRLNTHNTTTSVVENF